MDAAKKGNTETLKILLEHGAYVNHKDNNGYLHYIITLYLYTRGYAPRRL